MNMRATGFPDSDIRVNHQAQVSGNLTPPTRGSNARRLSGTCTCASRTHDDAWRRPRELLEHPYATYLYRHAGPDLLQYRRQSPQTHEEFRHEQVLPMVR